MLAWLFVFFRQSHWFFIFSFGLLSVWDAVHGPRNKRSRLGLLKCTWQAALSFSLSCALEYLLEQSSKLEKISVSRMSQADARQSSAGQDGLSTSSSTSSSPPLLLQFSPLPTQITPNFWHTLTTLKLDTLRLSDDAIPITARYGVARRVPDRSRGGEVAVPGALAVDEESLAGAQQAG